MKVLVVDDDVDILSTVMDQLELESIAADCASNARQALTLVERDDYDVIVLDIMMRGMDGLAVCRQLRRMGVTTPILFLTARDTLGDKGEGFSVGGDDYLVKPFAMEELIWRVKALSARISRNQSQRLQVGDLVLDVDQSTVSRSGLPIELNRSQFKILRYLMSHSPNVVSREKLEEAIWQDEAPESDALRSHLYQLRKAVDKPFNTPLIETVRGRGYRIASGEAKNV